MKTRHRIFALLTAVMVAVAGFSAMPVTHTDAYAMSQSSAKKKVKSLNKQLKQLKKNLSRAKAEDAQMLSKMKPLNGTIICPDPVIVSDFNTHDILYFASTDNLSLGTSDGVSGYYTVSDQIVFLTGYNCKVASAVEQPHAASDVQKKIDSKRAEKSNINTAMNDSIIVDDVTIYKGQKAPLSIHWKYGTPAYNTLSFSAKNKKIATVSSDGIVTAKKKGTVTYTVKLSASGNKTTFRIRVV